MFSMEFILSSIVLALIPGSGVLFVLSTSLSSQNKKDIFIAVLGCSLAILPHIILAIFSLYLFINLNEEIFIFIKYLGLAYLLYLAFSIYRSEDMFCQDKNFDKSKKRIFIDAILINLLNPKLSIFLIAYIPQYINTNESNKILSFLILSFIFILITFFIFILYGLFASSIKNRLINTRKKRRYVQSTFSLLFLLLCFL